MQITDKEYKNLQFKLANIQQNAIRNGLTFSVIEDYELIFKNAEKLFKKRYNSIVIVSVVAAVLLSIVFSIFTVDIFISARCLLPSNYLVWEATRPLANCSYCINVTKPIILRNVTRSKFDKYAYSSKPIIVKNAIGHWRAVKEFHYDMFKKLYEDTVGSYESLEEGCQFLNFKSDLFTLREVFSMPRERVNNDPGQKPWGNCHQGILHKLRKYYSVPNFLPDDAEYPATEHIFMGYEIGAVMHLDYIERLMWQGQVKGMKKWSVAPVPECEHVCHKFKFYVEPLDIVMLDTRIWYHETTIPKGQFSITVQSEYG
ncbi:uncharacterized protein LOC119840825 isoform X2 [Zerene cesonia]|uniref:uncharacterized protein LOC119840825 isoform X2 n=1 Tax=Zerene cesonia TaxID=33412 RepID=UPI0018E57330|nr:uncharacterized protein LOC119840825 isoform X2 [Zerene cesonia]